MEKLTNIQKAAIENMLGVYELDYWDIVEKVFPNRLVNMELDCLSYGDAVIVMKYINKNYGPKFSGYLNGLCKVILTGLIIYWVIILLI